MATLQKKKPEAPMSDDLPEKFPSNERGDSSNAGDRHLHIGSLHHHGNDLKALEELAQHNSALAEKVVDNHDAQHLREHVTERFGNATAVVALFVLFCGLVSIIVLGSIWDALILIGVVLAVALFIRVILTGEWSDTTWFGQLMEVLVRALGGKVPSKSDEEESADGSDT